MQYDNAADFLRHFSPNHPLRHICFKPQSGGMAAVPFKDDAELDQLQDIIDGRQAQGINLYFAVNPVREARRTKASKADIACVTHLFVDLDPPAGTTPETLDQVRAEMLAKLQNVSQRPTFEDGTRIPTPTWILDSGGGYWAFWELLEPVILETEEDRKNIELYGKALEAAFEADNTHNVDRIARLPFTQNIPDNDKKVAQRGPEPRPCLVVAGPESEEDRLTWPLSSFRRVQSSQELLAEAGIEGANMANIDTTVAIDTTESPIEVMVRHGVQKPVAAKLGRVMMKSLGAYNAGRGRDVTASDQYFFILCDLVRAGCDPQGMFELSMRRDLKGLAYPWKSANGDAGIAGEQALRQITNAVERVNMDQASKALEQTAPVQQTEDGEEVLPLADEDPEGWERGGSSVARPAGLPTQAPDPWRFIQLTHHGSKNRFQWGTIEEDGEITLQDDVDFTKGLRQFSFPNPTDPGRTTKYSVWVTQQRIRQYRDVVFDPTGKADEDERLYNTWTGWPVTPEEGNMHAGYLGHIRDNICNGDPAMYEYVMNWFAHLVQRPGDLTGKALVIHGKQGTGKGVMMQIMGKLFGRAFYQVNGSYALTSRFNSGLKNKLLVFGDEVQATGKTVSDKLKGLITDEVVEFEEKGKEKEACPNVMNIVLASNDKHVINAEDGDRRYVVLNVSDRRKEDGAYFEQITKEMEFMGGLGNLMHELLNRDISNFKPGNSPFTAAKATQMISSLSPFKKWLHVRLCAGMLPTGESLEGDVPQIDMLWSSQIGSKEASYDMEADMHSTMEQLYMRHWGSEGHIRSFRAEREEDRHHHPSGNPEQAMWRWLCWKMPSIEKSRELFAGEFIHPSYEWPGIVKETVAENKPDVLPDEPF